MADIVTGTVTGQVDMGAVYRDLGTIRRELAVDEGVTSANIKDGTDTVKDQNTAFYIAAQQAAYQNASALAALTAGTNAQFVSTQTAIELAQAGNAAATALATAATQLAISQEGEKTRALFQASKIEDLRFESLYLKSRDRGEGDNRGRRGCGNTKFNFGAPTGAVVEVENA